MHSWRVQQRLIVTLLIAIMAAATASQESQCQTLSLQSTVKLRRGDEMPLFGLGTWLSEGGGTCKKAVTVALEHGYRLIDTATMYQNEADVGEEGEPEVELSGVWEDFRSPPPSGSSGL